MDELICTTCGHIGRAETITKGSFVIELALWLCFIVPGLIYGIWRLSSRTKGCAKCGGQHVIPVDSPVGRKLVSELSVSP